MPKLLIIEDSVMMQKVIKHVALSELDCLFDIAGSLFEAQKLIGANNYYLALADLHLPDAPHGEIVDVLKAANIATIVLTASVDEKKRRSMLKKGVLDYILKESRDSYYFAVQLSNQIYHNRNITVLLADDSRVLRSYIRTQLEKMLFNVVEVINGVEALAAIELNPDIGLLITDFNMPKMNGIELIRAIRKTRHRDSFPIIGLSSSTDQTLSAQFIKYGANDFLVTPFIHEEFQWRILRTMEQIQLIAKITAAANNDHLTQLHNRRYFFAQAKRLYQAGKANQCDLVVALIDIDFFKKVNDEYGHDSGDVVLKQISKLLLQCFENCIVARYGGEEFIILIDNKSMASCTQIIEAFRVRVAANEFKIPTGNIFVTVSVGAALRNNESLEQLISLADKALYQAKENGRNQLVIAGRH